MENENVVFLNNLDAGSSGLLGEFTTSDTYIIADDVKQDLLKANKLITDYKSDKITANATAGSYTFEFLVYIQLGEQNKKRATLFLQEKTKLGFVEKELLTHIKSVIIEAGQNLMSVAKKEFNLFVRDETEGVDMANENLKALLNRKAQVSSRSKYLANALYDADKAYVMKMLGLIKGTGPYGDRFITQFKNMLKARNLNKADPKYWNTVKRLLDRMIAENSLLFSGKAKARMEEMQKAYRDLVAGTKEPAKDAGGAKKKGGGKASKPKKIKAYEGVKYSPPKSTPWLDAGKSADVVITRASTPYGSSVSRITSNPHTNSAVFSGLMSPIYTSNLTRGRHRRGREQNPPTPAPEQSTGGMERV